MPTASAPIPTLPVAATFGAPVWGVSLPESSRQHRPIVTGDRVVFLDGEQARAVDPTGKQAWSAKFAEVDSATRTHDENNYPMLRLVAPDVVAVVDQGKAKGQGLNEDAYAVKVTLLNVLSGAVVKTVTLPGTNTDSPKPSTSGLGFTVPGGKVSAVLPDGSVKPVPAKMTAGGQEHQVIGALTVGAAVLSIWGGTAKNPSSLDKRTEAPGFGGRTWDSVSVAPSAKYTTAEIEASDADRLIVGRWVVPGSGPDKPKVQVQVLDATSGKVLSKPNCEPDPTTPTLIASPNREHLVDGPLRLGADGKAECIGGGSGQKRVSLSAVTDSGRAFGTAGSDLVDVAADGTAKTVPLPSGATAPIGIMTGNVAVHWNANSAVITGNPIQ
ncbi:MAG: hypothetical protein L0H96_18350 [Humibacillus sp.]|nr:hypothetical protein [Humibacillus sp.]MDN5778860.1 hypothetical protein [Humibacillus sp.]